MSEIHIGPKAQGVMIAALVAAIIAAIVLQLPEIRRYIRIERM